jgi:putative transposase
MVHFVGLDVSVKETSVCVVDDTGKVISRGDGRMRKGRFSEEQIINVLKEHQAGIPVVELCRRHGISDATFYTWRTKYDGMEVSDARRLKALEDENRKLKKLLAESMLDVATLREALGKTSDAQFPEDGGDLGNRPEGLLAAARLRANRHCAEDLPLCHLARQ